MKAPIIALLAFLTISFAIAAPNPEGSDARDLGFALTAIGAISGTTGRDPANYFVTRFEKPDYSLLRQRSDIVSHAKKNKADSIVDVEPNHLSLGFRYWVFFRGDQAVSLTVEPTSGDETARTVEVSQVSIPAVLFERLQFTRVEIYLKKGSARNAYRIEEKKVEPATTGNAGEAPLPLASPEARRP